MRTHTRTHTHAHTHTHTHTHTHELAWVGKSSWPDPSQWLELSIQDPKRQHNSRQDAQSHALALLPTFTFIGFMYNEVGWIWSGMNGTSPKQQQHKHWQWEITALAHCHHDSDSHASHCGLIRQPPLCSVHITAYKLYRQLSKRIWFYSLIFGYRVAFGDRLSRSVSWPQCHIRSMLAVHINILYNIFDCVKHITILYYIICT